MPSLQDGDEAVSPVIGVILMVAITVVLAATVFFFVARINQRPDVAPHITMATDEGGDEAQVIRADTGLDWFEDMRTGGSCTPLLNGAAFPTAAGTPVRAGDVLSCQPGEDLTISSSDGKGNALLYETSFG